MRLEILDNGYNFGTKMLFWMIKTFSGYPLPDAAKLIFYRPEFYGSHAKQFTQRAMRGNSSWSVGDRELMAAFISKLNECAFCIKAHTAVASAAYGDDKKVEDVISSIDKAPIEPSLKATLMMLGKLSRENSVNADDVRTVMAAGVSEEQIENALAVCFAFNVTNRLADAFGFYVPTNEAFDAGAKYLLKRGYA